MPRKISFSATLALRPRISNMTVICMATKLNDSLERSFAEPAFQALPVGNFRDAYAGQKICQHELGIFPDRFLRANCAKRAVIRALIETLHKNQRPFYRFIDFFNRDRTGGFCQCKTAP